MEGQLILPPNYLEVKGSLIFLAGPIQGSNDWQREAVKRIQNNASELNIANPRRDYFPGEFVYDEQVDWETFYLRRAAQEGVIMFWLSKEQEHECTRAYGQTTRFELGEWKVKHEKEGIRLILGIEEGFTGAKYIRRRLGQDCPEITVHGSLEETCLGAIREARIGK